MTSRLQLKTGSSTLLIDSLHWQERMLSLAMRIALHQQVRILDFANVFNVARLMRPIRRHTTDMRTVLNRMLCRRASTCYEAAAYLKQAPPDGLPLLVLGMLRLFYDETVPIMSAATLLDEAIGDIGRLATQAPILVAALPTPSRNRGRAMMLSRLKAGVETIIDEPGAVSFEQLPLINYATDSRDSALLGAASG